MDASPIRIVMLDNHALLRAGLILLIESQPGMKVVGEAGNNVDGIEIVTRQKPDVVLLGLSADGPLTYEIVPGLVKACEQTRLILVTDTRDANIHHKAIEEGIAGVVFTTQSPETLIKAIQKVNAGEVWLERSMIANVLSRISRKKPSISLDSENDGITRLSEREKQVISLIGRGYKNKDISEELCISETTVRHHLTSIYNKLGVSDRLELLVYAHRNGMINPTTG